MTSIEERMATLEEKTRNFENTAEEIKKMLSEFINKHDNSYESLSAKFAAKWVEKFSIAILIAIVTAVFLSFYNYSEKPEKTDQPTHNTHKTLLK